MYDDGIKRERKIRTQTGADGDRIRVRTVRASASQGKVALRRQSYPRQRGGPVPNVGSGRGTREIALDDTLCFDTACSNHLMVSPPLRGSNPYPCGSLTYRILPYYCRTRPSVFGDP